MNVDNEDAQSLRICNKHSVHMRTDSTCTLRGRRTFLDIISTNELLQVNGHALWSRIFSDCCINRARDETRDKRDVHHVWKGSGECSNRDGDTGQTHHTDHRLLHAVRYLQYSDNLEYMCMTTHKGGSEISCKRIRAVPTAPVISTQIATHIISVNGLSANEQDTHEF